MTISSLFQMTLLLLLRAGGSRPAGALVSSRTVLERTQVSVKARLGDSALVQGRQNGYYFSNIGAKNLVQGYRNVYRNSTSSDGCLVQGNQNVYNNSFTGFYSFVQGFRNVYNNANPSGVNFVQGIGNVHSYAQMGSSTFVQGEYNVYGQYVNVSSDTFIQGKRNLNSTGPYNTYLGTRSFVQGAYNISNGGYANFNCFVQGYRNQDGANKRAGSRNFIQGENNSVYSNNNDLIVQGQGNRVGTYPGFYYASGSIVQGQYNYHYGAWTINQGRNNFVGPGDNNFAAGQQIRMGYKGYYTSRNFCHGSATVINNYVSSYSTIGQSNNFNQGYSQVISFSRGQCCMQGYSNDISYSENALMQGGDNFLRNSQNCFAQGRRNRAGAFPSYPFPPPLEDSFFQGSYNYGYYYGLVGVFLQGKRNRVTVPYTKHSFAQGYRNYIKGLHNFAQGYYNQVLGGASPPYYSRRIFMQGQTNTMGAYVGYDIFMQGYNNYAYSFGSIRAVFLQGYENRTGNGAHRTFAQGAYAYAKAPDQKVWGSNRTTGLGDAQCSKLVKYLQTTNATTQNLAVIDTDTDKTYCVSFHIAARNTTTNGESAAFTMERALVYNDVGAAVLVGAQSAATTPEEARLLGLWRLTCPVTTSVSGLPETLPILSSGSAASNSSRWPVNGNQRNHQG